MDISVFGAQEASFGNEPIGMKLKYPNVKRKELHTIYCYLIGHCSGIDFENKEVHDQFEEEYGFGSSEDNHTLNPYINYCDAILRDYGVKNEKAFLGSRKREMKSE